MVSPMRLLEKNKSLSVYFSGLVLLVAVASLVHFVFVGYRDSFHSDSAAKVLLAQEILRTGQFFPSTWFYVNGDLWLLGPQLFVLPFLLFFPVGYTAHACAATLNLVLLLLVAYRFQKPFNPDVSARMLVTALIATGLSWNGIENLFGQFAYSIPLILTMLYLSSSLTVLLGRSLSKYRQFGLMFGIWLIILNFAISNPTRVIVFFIAPLAIAVYVALRHPSISETMSNSNLRNLIWINLFGLAGGVGIRLAISSELKLSSTSSIGTLQDPRLWADNLWASFGNVFSLLGTDYFGPVPIVTFLGLAAVTKYLAVFGLVAAIFKGFRGPLSCENHYMRVGALFGLASLGIILLTTLFSNLMEPRYWQVATIICILIGASSFLKATSRWRVAFKGVTVLLIGLNILTVTSASVFREPPVTRGGDRALVEFLKGQNLTYGYASFWNAGKFTVLSESQIVIRQVEFVEGKVKAMKWLASEEWYSGNQGQKSFLMLNQDEAAQLSETQLDDIGLAPRKRFQFEDKVIYAVDFDLARLFPGWDPSFGAPQLWRIEASSPSQVGSIVTLTDSNNGKKKCIETTPGQTGFVYFGPYVSIDAGEYLASFDVVLKGGSSEGLYVDVAIEPDAKVLQRAAINSSTINSGLKFKIPKNSDGLQLRFFSEGLVGSYFCGMTIVATPK